MTGSCLASSISDIRSTVLVSESASMSLEHCSECGGKVSTRAPSCPHCGAPRSAAIANAAPNPERPKAPPGRLPIGTQYRHSWVTGLATGVGIGLAKVTTSEAQLSLPTLARSALIGVLVVPACNWLVKLRIRGHSGDTSPESDLGTA